MLHTTDGAAVACNDDGTILGFTMSTSQRSLRHSVACLRLQADCIELARAASAPALKSHFLRMAETWLAIESAGVDATSGRRSAEWTQ